MPVKTFRPLTPSTRYITVASFDEITKHKPEPSLINIRKKTGGRNCYGRVTARGIGGGHKQFYRNVDFKRQKLGMEAEVLGIEYDPIRTARLALLKYQDGEKRYILAPLGLNVGDQVMSGPDAEVRVGNALPLRNIPVGVTVHNVELQPGKGAQLVRTAGATAQFVAKEGEHGLLRLPSGEMRKVRLTCMATIGQVGNLDHENVSIGKAGRSRWLGIRPSVRGVAMNPHDHPLGGGEGKSSGGRHPCSPWGKLEGKTRAKGKLSDRYIVKRRK